MSSTITVYLNDDKQEKTALEFAYRQALPMLAAGQRLIAKVMPETLRENHSRHFHILIGQISGIIDGWRDYITDQQKQAGIRNKSLKSAI